jgi:hypothetical protein
VFGKLALCYADGTDAESVLLFAPRAASENGREATATPAPD